MKDATSRRLLAATVLVGTIFGTATLTTTSAMASPATHRSASAFTGVASSRVLVHLDLASGQQPENIVEAADGGVDVTFAVARQVAHISTTGETTVIATLPAPKDPTAKTPALGFPLTSGLVRQGSTLYTLYATGENATTGLWKITDGKAPVRIAALPGTGLPNGLALDTKTKTFYATDSVTGDIVTIPLAGGAAKVWDNNAALRPTSFLGANGIKLHDGDVYATNLDLGSLVRIPIKSNGTAGKVDVISTGLTGIDDFAFSGRGDQVIAALDSANEVVTISATGRQHTLLTAKDGLSNPTAVLIKGHTAYVTSAAYATQKDPNLLTANLK